MKVFFPGISEWETGALMSVGAMLGSGARVPGTNKRLSEHLLARFGPETLGFNPSYENIPLEVPQSRRDIFWREMAKTTVDARGVDSNRMLGRMKIARATFAEKQGLYKAITHGNHMWAQAEELFTERAQHNPVTMALNERLTQIAGKYDGRKGLQKAFFEVEGLAAQAYYGFFGADTTYNKAAVEAVRELGFRGAVGRLGRYGSIGVAAMGVQQLLTGGFFGSMEDSESLRDIYYGGKPVAVKKSRWWEGGGTPFEGGQDQYYRPHQFYLMMNRVREKGIWGQNEDDISPFMKFALKNFTYELERQNYWNRPYPISGAAFQDVPIIGGLLSATVGRLVKPPKLMHVQEWIREGEGGNPEFASVFEGSRREPSYALGATGPGIPRSPFDTGSTASFMSYQFRELEGLTGWAKNVIQQGITGEDTFGSDGTYLADAGQMTSPRVRFWETQMGGLAFSNEVWRRVLPRYRSEMEKTNPIQNAMPTWLPDKFRHGDPYRIVEWGEARLPGPGYAARFPHLQGIDPEQYGAIDRYAILGDVAPHSAEFRATREMVYQKRLAGETTEYQNRLIDQTDQQVRRVVDVYGYDQVDPNAIQLPGSGITQSMYLGGQELLRDVAAPAEYLVPGGIRPVQKLMGHRRDIVDQYEYERMYGTPLAFWDKPWRDWLRPSVYSAAHMMGFDGKPMWREEADKTTEYFDKLEFQKWMGLAHAAQAAGDGRAESRYQWAASQTRFGVNPQGSPMGIYWSLPAEDRKFFNAFANAQGNERERILEMVPKDQVHLYKAVWGRMDEGDPTLWGGDTTPVDEKYLQRQYYGLTAGTYGPQPPEDWIGWHEDVDMDDIAVRYVDRLGADLHDYGLWDSQLKKSMQQPALEGSIDYLPQNMSTIGTITGTLHNQMGRNSNVSVQMGWGNPSVVLDFNDRRETDLTERLVAAMGY